MAVSVQIGWWVVRDGETVQRCPSYYAADYEVLRLKPGRYPLRLVFETGYLHPMPYWLTAGVDAERVEGALFNGCGGNNFGCVKLQSGESVRYGVQVYAYSVETGGLEESGRVEFLPERAEWARALTRHVTRPGWLDGLTWDELRAMAAADESRAA
jgi:hypothetical protein